MSEPDKENIFDFRTLLDRHDALGRHTRRFRKIDGKPHEPAFALHLRTAEYALQHHQVGEGIEPWAEAMEAYRPDTRAGEEAQRHWEQYRVSFNALAHALESTYEDRNQGENEVRIRHACIARAWEDVADEIFYFRAARPDLAEIHPLPTRQEFSCAVGEFFDRTMESMATPPAAVEPRAPTRIGEQRRAATQFTQMLGPKRRPILRLPPPTPPVDEADRVQTAIGMVEDPMSGYPWWVAFQNAYAVRKSYLQRNYPQEVFGPLLVSLGQAAHEVEKGLIIYSNMLCHNFHHPEAPQDEAAPFSALADAVENLRTHLPYDWEKLPGRVRFTQMQDAIKESAIRALEEHHANRLDDTPNRSSRNGGGPGYSPGGRR